MLSSGGKIFGGVSVLLAFAAALSWSCPEARAAALDVRMGGTVVRKNVRSVLDLRFRNMVRQNTDYSCGAAALATILTYYFGEEASEETILNRILSGADEETLKRIMKSGLSLLDLKNFAESLGYRGKGYRLDEAALKRLDRPAIGLVNARGYNHFVVITGIGDGKVYIADPVKGNLVRHFGEFRKMWNGIVLVFENKGEEKIKSHQLVTGTEILGKTDLLAERVDLGFLLDPSEF